MKISLIVAVSENGVIGRAGTLPWRLSADLKRFKRLTLGHHLLMGRKTFESIGKLLPGRTSIVLTRNQRYDAQGALVAGSLQGALRLADDDAEVFVIGGEQIYRLALPSADRMYITLVHAHVEGDVRFPGYQADEWSLIEESRYPADAHNVFDYSFRILDRRRGEES